MLQLIGERKFKPFECVGTKKETLIAFYLSYKKYTGLTRVNLPLLLEYFRNKILPKYPNLEKESKRILNSLPRRISSISERFLRGWNNQNYLPKRFEKILKGAIAP